MRTQDITVNLRPLNQQAPQTAGPVGRVERAHNAIFRKFTNGGQGAQFKVQKRPGFSVLPSTIDASDGGGELPAAPRWLASFRDQLVGCFSAQPYVRSNTDDKWIGRQFSAGYQAVGWQTLSTRPVLNLNTFATSPDGAAAGDFIAYVMRSAVSFSETPYLQIQDTAGVQVVTARSTSITNGVRVKVVSDGARFWVASQAVAMDATSIQVFDTSGTLLASMSIAWGAARDNWDIRYAPGLGQVVLATPLAGTTDMRFMTYAAGVITTVLAVAPAADCRKGVAFLDNTAGTNVYIAGCDNGFGVRGFEISSAGAITHTFAVDAGNTDYVGNLTGYAEFGAATPSYIVVAYSVLQDNTAGPRTFPAQNNLTRFITAQRAGGTLTVTIRSVSLASRAFHDDQGNYFATMYYQGSAFYASPGGFDISDLTAQPSYFTAFFSTTTARIVGQFENGFAAMQSGSRVSNHFNPWHLSSVAQDSEGGQHIPLGYLGEQTIQQASVFTAVTGIRDYVVSQKAGRPVEMTDELLIPGLQAARFDATVFVEDGLALAPQIISATPGTGGSGQLTAGEAYFVCAVYEWLDNDGNTVQSPPSIPFGPVTAAGGAPFITVVASTLRVTAKTGVRIAFYATFSPTFTATPGIILNKVGEAANSTAADSVTFEVDGPDTFIVAGQPMYTQPLDVNNPRALDYTSAPAFSRGITFDGRTFVIGYDGAIWFSQQRIEGQGSPFNPELRIVMPTTAPPVNIVPMDARLLILCADGTAWTVPSGGLPNATLTSGTIPQPEQLPFTVGTQGAALMLPVGALFAATKGAWLMDRGLNSTFIGAPVEDEIANGLEVLDICVDDWQRVYITLGVAGSGGTSQRMVVFDLICNAWATWDAPIAPVCAASWQGRYVFADPSSGSSRVWILDDDEATDFTDDGAAVIRTVELSSMSFGGPNGYESMWGMQFFGEYKAPHLALVGFTYDNADAADQTFTQPVGVDPGIYRWEVRQDKQKQAAVAVSIADSFDWPTLTTITAVLP